MDRRKLTNEDVKAFLLNAYFGDVTDPLYTAANSAYLDLNRTIEYKRAQGVTEKKKATLRQTCVEAICQKYNDAGIHFHYGQAQKWVNMTMKYLSVIDSSKTGFCFECLHVPIDSIVFDLAYEEFGLDRPANRWSRMTKEEYIDYQESKIKEIAFFVYICTFMKRFLAYFAAVFLSTAAFAQSWDAALDQYEQISEACIRLRQKAQEGEKVSGSALVPLLNQLSDLRKSLQTAGGNMTGEQRERFKAIRSRYDAAFGSRKAVVAVPCRKPDPLLYRAMLPPVPETGRPSPEPKHRPLTVPATPFHVSALLYVGIPDFCPGRLLSFTRGKWGGFVKGAVSLASMQASYACYADGTTDSGYIWTTGKEAAKRFNISAGGVFSPLDFLSFYAGAGYGKRQLFWEDTTSQWASVQDRSVSGMALDAGVLYSWRHLSLMAGVSAIGFKTVCAELGVGYCF